MSGNNKRMTVINLMRAAVLIAGAVFVLLGISRGEHVEVLNKAVRICLECIGIG